ncbi:MAG TPA: FKBP-type peptidyl-prolyl cis-trans isomerase [Kofleriaceae bacterium]
MRTLALWFLISSTAAAAVACHGDDDAQEDAPAAVKLPRRAVPQIPPPLDLRTPPADATRTASGLIYKPLGGGTTGAQPRSDDTVLVRYTGWRQHTGETFFTTTGRAQPIAIDLAHAAPGFREALPLLHAGEKAVLWMPPRPGTLEPVAYEVELVEVVASRPAEGASSAHPPASESRATSPGDIDGDGGSSGTGWPGDGNPPGTPPPPETSSSNAPS